MPTKTRALLQNLGAVLCWSIAPVLIRSVKNLYPAVFQAFFRYFVSLLVLWPVLLFAGGSQSTRRAFRLLPSYLGRLLIIGGVNYLFQVSYTYAFYLLYPGLGTLIYQSGVIFSVLLAALFFPDERPLLHSRRFQLGLLASLAGVMLTVASGGPLGRLEFNLGVLVVLIATASWSLLSVLVRKWLPALPPELSVTAVITINAPLFLLTHLLLPGSPAIPGAPLEGWMLLALSGLVGVGLGQALFYRSMPKLGVALSSSLSLLIPLLSGLLSLALLGERFSALQSGGGLLLLSGCYTVIRLRYGRHLDETAKEKYPLNRNEDADRR